MGRENHINLHSFEFVQNERSRFADSINCQYRFHNSATWWVRAFRWNNFVTNFHASKNVYLKRGRTLQKSVERSRYSLPLALSQILTCYHNVTCAAIIYIKKHYPYEFMLNPKEICVDKLAAPMVFLDVLSATLDLCDTISLWPSGY